ncbi:MAG TPA: hypothetical protein VG078_02620 [Acidimicrobiales bacterium]|nr:hypothetical protein [Acidimicrobiales bacterium]
MTTEQKRGLRRLEGHKVHLALADGSRIDDADLVSARGTTLWLFTNGEDAFVDSDNVIDAWETPLVRPAAA